MIKIRNLSRTRMGYPSRWEGTTSDGRDVLIEYGQQRLSVKIGEEEHHETPLPGPVRSGQMLDHELIAAMKEHFPDIELPRG